MNNYNEAITEEWTTPKQTNWWSVSLIVLGVSVSMLIVCNIIRFVFMSL